MERLESLGYVGGDPGRGNAIPQASQEDPKDFVAVFERCKAGYALMGKRHYEEAQKILSEVVALRPRLILPRNWLADMALKQHHPAEAINNYPPPYRSWPKRRTTPAAASRGPKAARDRHLHKLLAGALLMDGKPDPAIAELEPPSASCPTSKTS